MSKSGCILALAALFAASAFCEDITPRVSLIQVFGLHRLSTQKVLSAVGIHAGDKVPARDEAEERLRSIPGVLAASVQPVCCFDRGMVLYIGIQEKNAPRMEFHAPPSGSSAIPADLAAVYESVLDAAAASVRARNADEDLTNGYSLMADPEGRAEQEQFLPMVAKNLTLIDQVVRDAADPEQRSMAAYLLQYAPRTPREIKVMSDDLQYALQDPVENVRSSAMVALKAVMVGARLHKEQRIRIEPTWFIELMNSVDWSDRHQASLALLTLTDSGDPAVISLIRERALDSVTDMAGWTDLKNALPGFILAGRLAGLPQNRIEQAWVSGKREDVIDAARKSAKKNKDS